DDAGVCKPPRRRGPRFALDRCPGLGVCPTAPWYRRVDLFHSARVIRPDRRIRFVSSRTATHWAGHLRSIFPNPPPAAEARSTGPPLRRQRGRRLTPSAPGPTPAG